MTNQFATVWHMILGGNRRMSAASTAGYQMRSDLKFQSSTGRLWRGEQQAIASAASHQRRHAC
jgi:hypothetical protein